MASFVDSIKLVEALEKMALIPCLGEENTNSFSVKGCGIETNIQGVSSFEAVTKMSYLLLDLNLLSSASKCTIEVCETATRNHYFYNVCKGTVSSSYKVQIELDRVLFDSVTGPVSSTCFFL